jgi:hypothetical protein
MHLYTVKSADKRSTLTRCARSIESGAFIDEMAAATPATGLEFGQHCSPALSCRGRDRWAAGGIQPHSEPDNILRLDKRVSAGSKSW